MAGQFVFRVPRRADNASSRLSRSRHPHHTVQRSSGITFVICAEVVLVNSGARAHHAMSMSNGHEKLTRPMDWSYCLVYVPDSIRHRLRPADLSPDIIPGKNTPSKQQFAHCSLASSCANKQMDPHNATLCSALPAPRRGYKEMAGVLPSSTIPPSYIKKH